VTATQPGRRINLGRSLNCRDVGGHAAGAGVVRHGLLFRSDLPLVDDARGHHLEPLGLRTVIDLREPDERIARPVRLATATPRIVSMPSGLGPLVAADPTKAASLTILYRTAILETGPRLAEIVSELARPGALPALVHCAAGKDRTGIVVALVLSALGVADEDVARDYALSAENLGPEFFAALDETTDALDVDLTALRSADDAEMVRLLALVREVAGDARAYLRHHGVSEEDLNALTRALVDDGGEGSEQHGDDPA